MTTSSQFYIDLESVLVRIQGIDAVNIETNAARLTLKTTTFEGLHILHHRAEGANIRLICFDLSSFPLDSIETASFFS